MQSPKLVNVKKAELLKQNYKDFEDWIHYEDHIYIGRDMSYYVKGTYKSLWCNPFSVKKYGRAECLKLYKEYIRNDKNLYNNLDKLHNKTLGCWCVPEKCHGDILQ